MAGIGQLCSSSSLFLSFTLSALLSAPQISGLRGESDAGLADVGVHLQVEVAPKMHECEVAPETRDDANVFFTSPYTYKELLGWSIYGLVTALGEGDYRKAIFQMSFEHAFPHLSKKEVKARLGEISFGKTYQLDYNVNDLLRDVEEVALTKMSQRSKRYYFFTATDPVNLHHATHFISYILDRRERKVHVFDPAEGVNGIGMMQGNQAYISATEVELRKHFRMWGYKDIVYYPKTYAPQTDIDDTYCQSWSLYLAIRGFVNIIEGMDAPIEIPRSRVARYELLLNFWKSCFQLMAFRHVNQERPGFADFCEHQYRHLRWSNGLSETYCNPDDILGHESELLLRVAKPTDVCLVSMDAHNSLHLAQKHSSCQY